MIDLGTLGADFSMGLGSNDLGGVVGQSTIPSGIFRAFRWTERDGITQLGDLPPHSSSRALDVNNAWDVVGSITTAPQGTRAVLFRNRPAELQK